MSMGRNGKRKYSEHRSKQRPHNLGVGDVLDRHKRARLSPEYSEDGMSISNGNMARDDGGWQTVTSKSSRRRANVSNGQQFDKHVSDPQLTMDRLSHASLTVQISQLWDLILYVLAEGTAPTWIAVNRAYEIQKVVAVMLPGLDYTMIHRAKELVKTMRQNPQSDQQITDRSGIQQDLSPGDEHTNNQSEGTPLLSNADQSSPEKSLRWLLDDIIPVKAPGDAKYSKVHSPLQAMLMKSAEEPQDNNSTKKEPAKTVRTPIAYFVHSADDLREAEYPVHPAAFTSQADAILEASRRRGAKQAAEDGWRDSEVATSSLVVPAASSASPRDSITQGLTIYAIDCEMVLTSDEKSSLARISVVSWPKGEIILDEYVKPDLEITNYFTQYSGITPAILANVTTTLSDIQTKLMTLFTPSAILLGHSLESDLNALKMTHPFIIDTSIIYPHPRGLPLRSSLKFLANKYLRREIQNGGANGHNSVEDARAVLDLVKLKCEKGPSWGTSEAHGESIFKRLSGHTSRDGKPRTSAIVEYGTPERGFGKDATVAIGCQNDDDIIRGILDAANGTTDRSEIPEGGVDFVWGRLRALEFARGWASNNTNNQPKPSVDLPPPETSNNDNASITPAEDIPTSALDRILQSTLHHIQTLHDSLPKSTLLVLYSGTSDMRPVLQYQAMQAQYRREFKVKKWDELSVKWTDVEEQALRRATEKARRGWGWVGIL